jgi:Mn-dependent DtxR family transcriptional regulator
MLVLQGMTDILKTAGPALFVELSEPGLNKFGASVSAILRLLSDNGYEAYWLTRTGRHKANQSEIQAKTAETEYVDVLFLKTGP